MDNSNNKIVGAINTPTPIQPVVTCLDCSEPIEDIASAREYRDSLICVDCYYDNYARCEACMGIERHDDINIIHDDDYYCNSCIADRRDSCDCGDCNEGGGHYPEREYSSAHLPAFQSNEPGKVVKSTRVFSAEIECYAPSAETFRAVFNSTDKAIGVTGDGSLDAGGVEFQTPKLKGKNGEDQLRALCNTLNRNGFTVNRSTGLHIHLDGRGLLPRTLTTQEPKALKQLWAFYHHYEPVLHSFLPASRRQNTFCKPLATLSRIEFIKKAKTLHDLEVIWYRDSDKQHLAYRKSHKFDNSRYCGVNLHSLLGAKHLEIRYHSGTLNPTKILEWINLHLAIMDKAAAKALPLERTAYPSVEKGAQCMLVELGLSKKSCAYFMRRQRQFTTSTNEEGTLLVSESN